MNSFHLYTFETLQNSTNHGIKYVKKNLINLMTPLDSDYIELTGLKDCIEIQCLIGPIA